VELYENYPALASVLLNYEPLLNYGHTRQLVTEIINNRKGFVKSVIERAQAEGEVDNWFSSQQLVDIIEGILIDMILRWKMSGYSFSLKREMLATIKRLLDRV
jgi:hypothetical protein